MQLKTINIPEQSENFNQWLTQLASEYGFALSVETSDNLRRYQVKRDGESVAEIESLPVGDRLRLRPARIRQQRTPGGAVRSDFIEILDKALQSDYRAEPIEGGISGSFLHGILDLGREHFDNPEDDTKSQAHNAELSRGLPPIAQSEPPTMRAQAQGTTPTKPNKSEPLGKWFAYFHDCEKNRIHYTLKDLAKDANLSYGHIRTEHAKYQAEHAEQNT